MVYDIAISGLGPAGASFLRQISGKGFKIIGFDRESFPRKKLCAGGLTPKAYDLLKKLFPELDKVVRVQSKRFILINDSSRVEVSADNPLTYLTDREELDNFLFDSISNRDFEIHTGETVLSLEKEDGFWKVRTDKETYRARVVIAADGVNSRIARQFNIKRNIGFTYEVDVEFKWNDSILIDFSGFSSGYYWVFPKGDFVTAGLGEFKSKAKSLKGKLFQFNKKHGIEGKLRFQKGFPIPAGKRKNDVYRERLLFLGDAGGLVDPLTGEGIYYAVRSGVIAAEVVAKSFEEGNLEILKLYKELVDRVMGSEFFWAKVVGNLFFNFKRLNFYVIKRKPEVGSLTSALLTGEVSYRDGIRDYFKLLPKSIVRF